MSNQRPKRAGDLSEHEAAFIENLVNPRVRERWSTFLLDPRYRQKARDMLESGKGLDLSRVDRVNPQRADKEIAKTLDTLVSLGAPVEAYVISTSERLDGRFVKLEEVLREIHGYEIATYVSCVPGQLGYLELEGENERFIFRNQLPHECE